MLSHSVSIYDYSNIMGMLYATLNHAVRVYYMDDSR